MKRDFALNNEPLDYIISVHIVNMLQTENLDEDIKMIHINNLINTYGLLQVEFTIKDLFPELHNELFKKVA